MIFVCRKCGSRFVSLRSARVHLRGCVSGYFDVGSHLQVLNEDEDNS